MLTKTQVKVILILLDNKGHAGWELAEYLRMEDSNLNPLLKKLEKVGIIYKGESRSSKREHKKNANYEEDPYYLSRNINGFKILINEISDACRLYDAGFVLEVIKKSKYIKFMKEVFKEDIDRNMDNELRRRYSPFLDPFFVNVIEPELEEELFCNLERKLERTPTSEIQVWYKEYLRMRQRKNAELPRSE